MFSIHILKEGVKFLTHSTKVETLFLTSMQQIQTINYQHKQLGYSIYNKQSSGPLPVNLK